MTTAVSTAYQTKHDLLTRTPNYRVKFQRSGRQYANHKICDYLTEVMADVPVGFWRFDEASGAIAIDKSGNGLNGVYVNTPTLAVTGPLTGSSKTAATFTAANSE